MNIFFIIQGAGILIITIHKHVLVYLIPSPFRIVCDGRLFLPHGHRRHLRVVCRWMGLQVCGGRRIMRGAAPGISVHVHRAATCLPYSVVTVMVLLGAAFFLFFQSLVKSRKTQNHRVLGHMSRWWCAPPPHTGNFQHTHTQNTAFLPLARTRTANTVCRAERLGNGQRNRVEDQRCRFRLLILRLVPQSALLPHENYDKLRNNSGILTSIN